MKMRFKRFLSGFMAVATLASVIVQPVMVSASELEPEPTSFEQQYPELQDVQDTLDKDEIVEAKDIEIPYGEEFEVEVDLSGIEGVNEKKVKVLFHEAKSEAGTDFDAHTPDTYKAVYAVEPVSGHPAYRVSRNITVKEPETEAQTKSSSENTAGEGNAGETEDSGNAEEDADSDGSKEIVTDLTDDQEVTTDEESGLTVSEVMDQAENEGIDLYEMEPGETVTFMAAAGNARSSQQVSVTRGAEYRYADYGYGTYLTYQYTVKFGNVSATAYCVQPSKPGPGTGTYTINKVGDGKALAKVCYYGTKASGDDGFFTEENGYGNLSAGARFILVHLAASYANGSSDAFSGANTTAQNLAKKLYNYCISQPDIPDVAMSFSDADVTAYVDGNSQRTKEITFKADELQSITMKLPSGVKLHNVTTGKTSKAGEAVEISGGTKFYLSAPLTQVQDVAGNWSATMKGSVTKDYSAYKISTGSGSQDLALVFGEGVDDEKYVDFKVTWVQYASVKVIKKDAKADAKLAGAVFGLYSDANCTNLITKLPATDANGEASVQIIKTQNTVYLKEITAPTGYVDSFGFQELPEFVQQRMNLLEHNSVRAYPPVYKGTLEQAMGERDVDAYLDSRKLNLDCKKAIEEAIRENFDGLHLKQDAAKEVVERFGEERMNFVMANTIRELSHDGRFSRQNKDWAEHIEVPENINRGRNLNLDYVIESHPAVLDGFIDMARAEIRMQRIEQAIGENEVTITAETRGYEAEGHNGTWHTVDKKEYAGEKFFLMEHDEFGSDVAGIIVAENGQLVAEDLWNGFDEGALEAVSEYLQENGTTLYDLTEFPKDSAVTLRSGQTLTIEEIQAVQKDTWEETMAGKNESGTDVRFNFHAVSEVQLPEGIKLKMPEIHYIDNFYVMEDVNAEGVVKVNRYESLDEAMQEYLRLPNHQEKVLGIQNTETMQENMDFIRCENGIDQMTHAYEQIGGWLNPEIYEAVNKMENMLDWNEVQIAYQIGKQYFTIQTAEDGYDYTFYNEDYQEDDGGIYDNPTIYVDEAASDILEDKGYSLEDAKVVDYEELMADVEEVQEEQMQRIQLEKNCPASIFEGFRREEAMQTYEGIAMQFTRSKGYLTIQATEEGYSFIFYDSDLHEIQSGDYDNPDASIQEAAYEILKSERMDDMECVKVDYKEFEEMTIQHSKDLLQERELRATSEIGRNELALNSLSRAEVERGVLYHAQAVLEDMGMEQEVELLAARVYGSRSRQDLYREDSDLDVVLSYRGNIREDSFFNELNAHGIAMAGIKVDINPIAEERITLAEYMKEADVYLDQQEIKKLSVDLDNFSYEYDTYEYKDTVENREEQVEKITEDILNKKTGCLKDWLVEVSEESDIDSDVITARSLLSRLEDAERFSIFDKQPEQEQPEATISFYVAECMEFPVMGEYHNNLTLEEAIKIYESIPAERLHGIKGIGFDLQDGDEDYSGEYELMSADRIRRDLIDMIPHYKESPLVQKAITDMEKYLDEKHGRVQEAEHAAETAIGSEQKPSAVAADRRSEQEPVSVSQSQPQKVELVSRAKGEVKKSVLQSLKDFQARAKAQEQNKATEKSKAHKKGEVEL